MRKYSVSVYFGHGRRATHYVWVRLPLEAPMASDLAVIKQYMSNHYLTKHDMLIDTSFIEADLIDTDFDAYLARVHRNQATELEIAVI